VFLRPKRPADASSSGVASPTDILKLVDHLNGVLPIPLHAWQCDINRSGACDLRTFCG
jgi:hypothetical protein